MRDALFIVVIILLNGVITLRQRAEPSEWFLDLILDDDSHDHSGKTAERQNHTCCHRLAFVEDPLTGDDLFHIHVPYNHWWSSGATMFSLATELNGPSDRMLPLGDAGLVLDFRQRSRLWLRFQCAYPCCLEAAEFILPPGAPHLGLLAGNATQYTASPRSVNRDAMGTRRLGAQFQREVRQEEVWDTHGDTRIEQLTMCDYDTKGMWIRMDSVNRIEAALAELDVCFVHHDMAMAWDNGLCEEA